MKTLSDFKRYGEDLSNIKGGFEMGRQTLTLLIATLVILLLASLLAASCGTREEETVISTSEQEPGIPPTLEGQSLVQERYTKCHDMKRITRAKKTVEEWAAAVERMVSKGANLGPAEQEAVIQYLAETYPK